MPFHASFSPNNLLKPSDGGPVAVPSQDMVLGIYYLTQESPGAKGEGRFFKRYERSNSCIRERDTLHCSPRLKSAAKKEMPDGTEECRNVEIYTGTFPLQ